jgi:hypothetical protein
MEMIFVGDGCPGAKTNVGAIMDTNAETWRAFQAARKQCAVDMQSPECAFILDFYNRRGDLAGSIGITRDGFRQITGEYAKSRAYYERIDREYWDKAKAAHRASSSNE